MGEEYSGNDLYYDGSISGRLNVKNEIARNFHFANSDVYDGAGMVRPYALVDVVGSIKIEDQRDVVLDNFDVPITYSLVEETKGEFAFGFRGGAGIDINIASKFSVYVEVIFNSISYYAKEKEVTTAILDGSDQLAALRCEKNTVFVDKITETYIDGSLVVDDTMPIKNCVNHYPSATFRLDWVLSIG